MIISDFRLDRSLAISKRLATEAPPMLVSLKDTRRSLRLCALIWLVLISVSVLSVRFGQPLIYQVTIKKKIKLREEHSK